MAIRGVQDNVMTFRPEVHIVEGRPPRPGTDEAIVGSRIRGRIKGVELGQSFDIKKNRPVRVVGVFEAGGSAYESEVWVDREILRQAYGRLGVVSSVRVRLESPAAFDAFRAGGRERQAPRPAGPARAGLLREAVRGDVASSSARSAPSCPSSSRSAR